MFEHTIRGEKHESERSRGQVEVGKERGDREHPL